MGLAFIPLYIQYMGIEAYGLIGLFAVIQVFLSLLDMGMLPTISREMARFTAGEHTPQSIHDLLRTLEGITYTIAILIVLLIWLASDWLASDWINAETMPISVVTQALSITALVIGLRFCEGLYRSAIIGLQKQVWLNIANSIFATVRYMGAVAVLMFYSPTIQAFFIWQGLVSFLIVITFRFKLYAILPVAPEPPGFSISTLKNVWRFASGMIGISLSTILLTQVDKVLLSKLITLEAFGYYTLATTVAGALSMITVPIVQAIYPRMVEFYSQGDKKNLTQIYHLGSQIVTAVLTPIVIIISFFPNEILYLWSGDFMLSENSGDILRLLSIGTFLNCLMWMPYHCQLAHGWTSLTLRVNIVAVLILVPAIISFVPQYGVNAAAWIWIILNLSYIVIAIQFMHTRILPKEKIHWYIDDLFIPILGTISIAFFINEFKPVDYYSRSGHWLLFLSGMGIVLFFVVIMLSNKIRSRALSLVIDYMYKHLNRPS